jgi:hypothetical protein
MIPKVGMFFDTEEHAYEMFRRYAEATGFPIKWDRKKHTVRDISCSMSGTWKYYKPEQQRTRNKFTKKTGCKVYMKLKHVSDMEGNNNGKVMIDKIRLDHNHPLPDTPSVTKQMRCHKRKEKQVMDDALAETVTPEVGNRYTHVSLFVFIFYSPFMIKISTCCLKSLLFLNSPRHCQRI